MSYICKIPTIKEMNEKWDYEIEIHSNKDNWIKWKKEWLKNTKEKKIIPYYGILDGNIICEITVSIDKIVVQNSTGLVDDKTAYLNSFRTKKEYQGQGYFSKLFHFVINDLKELQEFLQVLQQNPSSLDHLFLIHFSQRIEGHNSCN